MLSRKGVISRSGKKTLCSGNWYRQLPLDLFSLQCTKSPQTDAIVTVVPLSNWKRIFRQVVHWVDEVVLKTTRRFTSAPSAKVRDPATLPSIVSFFFFFLQPSARAWCNYELIKQAGRLFTNLCICLCINPLSFIFFFCGDKTSSTFGLQVVQREPDNPAISTP